MYWTGTRPTSPALVTDAQIMSQLRLTTTTEQQYWQDLIDACTEHAETALDSSLLTRAITATFYGPSVFHPMGSNLTQMMRTGNRLYLPRGPVQSITSVTDANNKSLTASLEHVGLADYAVITDQNWQAPLTIVYQAGYGSNVTDVPADIRMAIRTHVAHLFERREAADERQIVPVPYSLECFYKLRKRAAYVG